MRPNFVPLTLAQFQLVVSRYRFKRRITMVHVHHTWRPRKVDYRGVSTIQGMWRYHTEEKGWQDIAQHVTIAPDGTIWTGRSWDLPPVSSVGHNGNSLAGPFMFEIIGDFDSGKEKLEGTQRASVAGVIAAVQLANRLPPDAFRFHRELGSPKTCPGTGVEHDKLLAEVQTARTATAAPGRVPGGARRRARADGDKPRPFSVNDQEAIDQALGALTERSALAPDASDAEDTHDDDVYAARVVLGRDLVERPPASRGDDDFDAATLHALRPHVVNLSGGLFSTSGVFQTTPEDVDRIFDEHLPAALTEATAAKRPLRVLFWAHGGLTDEKRGLGIAARQIAWWKRNNIYPIYFVWETGLLSTIGQVLRGAKGRMRAIDSRDLWDHATDPLIEMTARALGGEKIWSGMKFSAERASGSGGGAAYVARRLGQFSKASAAAKVELHAVGHSAGSIFHAHFVPAAIREKAAPFESLHFLAPAIRLDEFLDRLDSHIGKEIRKFSLFTMAKDWEKRDDVSRIYRKSLLYLVSHAFEPNGKTPILGLEETIRSDARCRRLFGLEGGAQRGEAIWSKTTVSTGTNATTSVTHGGFDEDIPTMNSVARRVLGLGPAGEIESFPAAPIGRAVDEEELPEEVAWVAKLTGESGADAGTRPQSAAAMPSGAPMVVTPSGDGRRVALCIGIDDYPREDARLNGCVNDAKSWARTLTRLGFQTRTLLNEQATREGIVSEVTSLLRSTQPGDTMVLQYSGHGTRLPDVDGDEDDAEDEAMCAYDFDDGHFVIDDDLRLMFAHVPKGVSLTCFFDCCHSGTITRVVQQKRQRVQGVRGGTPKKRSLRATPAMAEAHRAFRSKLGSPSRAVDPLSDMAEVVFTACRSDQVAYESDGQGDFTRIALDLFEEGLPDESNDAFYQRILRSFGDDARQQPQLNSSSAARLRRLLARP